MRKLLTITIVLAMLGWAGLAQAIPCPDHSIAAVSGTSACALGSTNNDFLNPLQVNLDSMFGFNDWVFDAKDEGIDGVDEGANSLALSLTGNTLRGEWSIEANTFSDVMMVFKSGSNTIPDAYVGYLLSATSGSYESPFVHQMHHDNLKVISHVSLYVRGYNVPEPGTMVLLGIGLLGLGLVRGGGKKV